MSNRGKCNSKSQLLSDQENEFVFNVLGNGCFVSAIDCLFCYHCVLPVSDQTLATCVAQLFVVQCRRNKHQWIKTCCGVVCFVKDNPKRSYYIRLYDIQSQQMLWEQELYSKFKYNTPREFFHTFEAHDCHAGLNFASEDEAGHFKKAIETKLLEKHKKRLEREERKIEKKEMTYVLADEPEPSTVPTISISPPETVEAGENTSNEPPKMRRKKSKKKKKLTKEDVGGPANFQHVSHMSWGVDDGPHMDRLDSDMKALLKEIGIVEKSQVDNATMDFLYQFVDEHGGANAVREDFAWHIPAEPSHPAGETVDITKYLPAAPSHPVGTTTDVEQHSAAPSHSANKKTMTARPLPAVPTGGSLIPPSGVKVFDAAAIIRPLHTSTTSSALQSRPPPPSSKPPPNVRPSPSPFKPQSQVIRPPPPSTKPPPNVRPSPPPFKPQSQATRPHPPATKPPFISNHSPKLPSKQALERSTTVQTPSLSLHNQVPPTPDIQVPPTSSNILSQQSLPNIPTPPNSADKKILPVPATVPTSVSSDISAITPPDPSAPPAIPSPNPPAPPAIPHANPPAPQALQPPNPPAPPAIPSSNPPAPPAIPPPDPSAPPAIPSPNPSAPTALPPPNPPAPPAIPAPPTCSPPAALSQRLEKEELPAANNSKACLLNEINTLQGTSLRHVQTGHHISERAGLLNQIRTGATLKHVERSEERAPAKRGSIAAALMSQLMKRKTTVQFSDNEYSSDEFDDDWDED